jgi:replicative DNA helicase
MADLDVALASAIVSGGRDALRRVIESGLTADLLEGEGKTAYTFIIDFYKKYSALPTDDVVMAEAGVILVPSPEPLAYLVDALYERKLHKTIHSGTEAIIKHLERKEPVKGREAVEELLRSLRKLDTRGALVESLPALGDKVVQYYEKIKRGERGIQTPWPTINDATMGFWPEDLALFVARMGIGKTWSALQIAGCAWEQGKKVLVATTEMTKERMAMRYFAVKLRLPYRDFRQGKLDMVSEKKFYDGIQAMLNSPNFNIVGGDFDFAMETFAGIVMDEKPDLVVVDGAYLLKVAGLTRTERAANVFDELKRLAKRSKAAVIATMQFNREVKVNQAKTVQADSIAMTDVAGWNADLIFGLIQTEEMKKQKRMAFKPLKVREGEAEEIECYWDFDTMNFSEIPKAVLPGQGGIVPANVPTDDEAFDAF